jgi:hypothetical protein
MGDRAFPAESPQVANWPLGRGLLRKCKLRILTVCGEVAERLKAAVC